MKRISRRRFLKTGFAGAGMAALSPSIVSAASPDQRENIIYRTLGRTGLKVPVVSFGVMRSDNAGLCKAAYEKGITLFDTAYGYQGGNNETMLGNLFKNYPRNSFILATKVKPTTDREGRPNDQTSPEEFLDRERTKPMNTTAAIKWVLSNSDVTTTIPGMTNFDHLELNIPILTDIKLTDQEKNDLVAAREEAGLFCSGCRQCVSSCPHNLPIQDLMRAYMYAYGYSNPSMAKILLGELEISDNPCSSCNACTVRCPSNFHVKEKIADILRLVKVPSEFLA